MAQLTCEVCGATYTPAGTGPNPFNPVRIAASYGNIGGWLKIPADKIPDVPWLEKRDHNFCGESHRDQWKDEQAKKWEDEIGSKANAP